jgi:cell division protein FtsA
LQQNARFLRIYIMERVPKIIENGGVVRLNTSGIIVSLDIGSSQVRAIVGQLAQEGGAEVIGVGTADAIGIRKGTIVDIDKTAASIRTAVEAAERMVGVHITEVYVGIQGNHIGLTTNHGIVAVSGEDREIGEEDIARVMEAAKVVALPLEREIVNLVPRQFIVDGMEGITDPSGMIGVRLEVDATVVTAARTAIHNLVKCVESADLTIAGIILTQLATGVVSLNKEEKSIVTALADIGAGQSSVAIFDRGQLVAISTLPLGGDYVTNDIAIGLHTQTEQADKVKLKYGSARISDADEQQLFTVTRIGSNAEKEFNQVDLANIIEPRMQEILQFVELEVGRLGYADKVNHYILTGGSVAMPGSLPLAEHVLQSSVRIEKPDYIGVRDPAYTAGVNMIQYIEQNLVSTSDAGSKNPRPSDKPGLMQRLKNLFSEFI